MTCYHPKTAFIIGKTADGKKKLKFVPNGTTFVMRGRNEWIVADWPLPEVRDPDFKYFTEKVQVPCRQCLGCRFDYSAEWAARCMLEARYHENNYFVTLTYDDDHIPFKVDPVTGETTGNYSLCKRDFQLFMKRLRKAFPDNVIRYFCAGEYGSSTFRPHYHVILFGMPDLSVFLDFYKISEIKDMYYKLYTCRKISDIWQNGFVTIGEVTWESCAYTARYITKKLTGKASAIYNELGIDPEFSLMSRRPGLARKYYEDHKEDINEYSYISIDTLTGGRSFLPPKYYGRLFEAEAPDEYKLRQEKKAAIAEAKVLQKLSQTDQSYEDLLKSEEQVFKDKIKIFSRRNFYA